MSEDRDFMMARIAAARARIAAAGDSLDTCAATFCDPEEDPKGEQRLELLDDVDDQLGEASRAVQLAIDVGKNVERETFAETEPDLPEGDGYDEGDGDDEDDGDED